MEGAAAALRRNHYQNLDFDQMGLAEVAAESPRSFRSVAAHNQLELENIYQDLLQKGILMNLYFKARESNWNGWIIMVIQSMSNYIIHLSME